MTTKFIGIRLPLPLVHKLEKIAEQFNQSPNQMAKHAIIDWVEIFFSARNLNMITIPKELFVDYLDRLNDEEIEQYAEEVGEKILGFYEFLAENNVKRTSMEDVFSIIVRFLGANGLMWFEHLEYDGTTKPYYLKGIHNLGENWSKFFLAISQYLTEKHFPFILSNQQTHLSAHSVHVVFKEK